jgi:carboxyl-terminal processing protease
MAWASDYNSLSEEQKLVAEAWRLVDNSFLDRTFAKQDWWNVREQYVKRKYKSMEEARQAIAEFTATLQDPYTRYLPPSKYQSLVDSATGTLAGVGMEISTSGESSARHILASDVEPNSPASRAGIQPGDVFVQVAGTNVVVPDASAPASTVAAVTTTETVASTPEEVAALLRGPTNSKVNVVMERQGKTYEYILTREPITITSVSSYVIPHVNGWNNGKVGVIRIKSFSGTTASTVASKLQDLEQSQGVSALVLDLRSNPGGLLPGGVDTASLFLPANQPVVYVVDKKGVVTSSASLADGMDLTTPLVVLVDANTASAAEVVTAALQEDQRAIIVGQQTFGKGIVQTIRSLQEGQQGGLAITVARYETPLHHDINKQGVMVDVSAPMDCPKKDVSACLPAVALTKAQELLQQK